MAPMTADYDHVRGPSLRNSDDLGSRLADLHELHRRVSLRQKATQPDKQSSPGTKFNAEPGGLRGKSPAIGPDQDLSDAHTLFLPPQQHPPPAVEHSFGRGRSNIQLSAATTIARIINTTQGGQCSWGASEAR